MSVWTAISENWHKILVVIIALVQGVQYAVNKFGSSKTEKQNVTIQLPEKGCTITVKPLE
jgi:hypothetical protein